MTVTTPYRLDLNGREVVVCGGSSAAIGPIAELRDAGALVTVIAESTVPTIDDLADRGLLHLESREFDASDLDRAWFVVAATGKADVDGAIVAAAETHRILHSRVCTTSVDRLVTTGSVTLVGGGPGDPGLVTVAGRDAIENADVIITDRLAPVAALRWARDDAEIIDVAKIPGGRSTSQDEINRLLIEHAKSGKRVVRFKGGDNFVFGRGGEELIVCLEAGIETTVVPGVSSAIAAPALANIPVTHRGLNQGFTVISGHVPPGHPDSTLDYAALATAGTSLVLLMAVRTLRNIAQALIDGGMPANTPAAIIADGAMPSQQAVRATVGTIADAAADANVTAPAVTVIGEVAAIDGLL